LAWKGGRERWLQDQVACSMAGGAPTADVHEEEEKQ